MSQSVPYQVSAAVVAALKAQLEPGGIVVVDNPTTAAALDKGDRVVFVEDADDTPIDKPGQAEGRTFGLRVGVINRTAGARAGADADALSAKPVVTTAMRDCAKTLQIAKVILGFQYPRESQRTYRHESIDVGGALILTRFELDYRLPAPRPQAA